MALAVAILSGTAAAAAAAAVTPSAGAGAGAGRLGVVVPLNPESVGALVGMGIEEAWAAAALRRCGGEDVARAVDYCFSHDMKGLAEEDARAFEVS